MTPLTWSEHPAARAEYFHAVAWYENQEIGLGERLATALDSGVDFVRAWPEATSPYPGQEGVPALRRKSVDVFPFGIFYFLHNKELIIVAYAHEKRSPGYWQSRLKDY